MPRGKRMKIVVAGFFNVAIFNAFSAYAQIYGTVSGALVIAYSMPIWAALLAHFVLKEKLAVGERPSSTDIIGYVMIFAAAARALLQPNMRHTELPE